MIRLSKLTLLASLLALSTVHSLLAEDKPTKDASKTESTAEQKAESKAEKKAEKKAESKAERNADVIKKHHAGHAHLGVVVSSAHPALASNLGDLLSPEQGLVVDQVLPNSPAAKVGIKVNDVLTTYDDQKLFSAEQLAKLVHSDHTGREVSLGYLRDGKLQKVQVALSELKIARHRAWPHSPETTAPGHEGLRHFIERLHKRLTPRSSWEHFDSLTLKSLGDKKFRAEVQHLDQDKKPKHHVFEGTREEIKKAIEADQDLGEVERNHLLRSLDLQKTPDELMLDPEWFYDRSESAR